MEFDYKSTVFDLPDDINRAKLNGNFDLEKALIDERLSSPRTSDIMKTRLKTELLLLDRWLKRYVYSYDEALEICRRRIKDFKDEELEAFEKDGCVEYIFVNGEKKYLSSFCSTLIKMLPEVGKREIKTREDVDDGTAIKPFIAEIKQKGSVAYRYKIKSSLKIEDEAFKAGSTYTVHFPIPAPSAQQRAEAIKITAAPDAIVAPADALQRTVCFKRKLDNNAPFEAEFEFESKIIYVDPMKDEPYIVYPDAPAPTQDDLKEEYPHIIFTPYLKMLAKEIVGEETRPLYIAKKIYDYITLNVRYSFMRPYALIDRQAEYCALNMKGDCGIQALLFITLCRICGVPARWQSGLTVDKFSTGDHDWAQFYTEEFGWLFADPSYGGGGTRQMDEEKRLFYFGNLDPFRMVANRGYMSEYVPPKRFIRSDPCDNQDGEVEDEFTAYPGSDYDKTDTTLEFIHL